MCVHCALCSVCRYELQECTSTCFNFLGTKFNSKCNIYSASCLYNKISLFLDAKPFDGRNSYKVYKVHSTGLDSALNTYCLDDFGFLGYSKKFLTFQTFPLVKHVIDIEWEYTSVRKLSLQSLQNPFFR